MKNKFYITTPIYYVNEKPHIGSACTTLLADILARYHKLKGEDVFFLTGTDEHGAKVAQEAAAAGEKPQEFCDRVSKTFSDTWPKLNIQYDYFIRTTNPEHKSIVRDIVTQINNKGDVYKGKYEGWYCLGCEKFITETELVNKRCPFHQNKNLEWHVEDNYFFKLTKYIPTLIEAIENPNHPHYYEICPESKKKEVLARLKAGVNDISISRSQVTWGIPLPWDPKHTIYVWVEALFNYYTALKINDKMEYWPVDIHTMAKDILWFHTVIWQALLLSIDYELPKKIFIHSFYMSDGHKMSKSLGNVIRPDEMIIKYGVDGTRYLIASSIPTFEDSNVSFKKFDEKYNADLANGLGNLVARIAKLCEKSGFGIKPDRADFYPEIEKYLNEFRFSEALDFIQQQISLEDKRVNENKPWQLEGKELKDFLSVSVITIHQIAYSLLPFIPETANKIIKQFSLPAIVSANPLFPRITS